MVLRHEVVMPVREAQQHWESVELLHDTTPTPLSVAHAGTITGDGKA